MKVHLIRSENYNIEDFNNVLNLLQKHRGSIEFVPSKPIVMPESQSEELYETKKEFETQKNYVSYSLSKLSSDEISFPHKTETLTWKQLFNVCDVFRENYLLSDDEQVILLNDVQNDRNWFGCVDSSLNNYFVQTVCLK